MICFHQHADIFLLTPCLAVQAADCDEPECGRRHWQIQLGWLMWSLEIYFG